ncbi:hypothetical protein FH972_018031 [Carpinus fangiana]|uniref:K-box domain-containing protein n=1 Tax=Carpinus fangiana TaxID=176857 RepID=A0A5N6RKY8_9ROSI|nr:hypothetical protein FH972_018031 [Carpinus fangiana]
MSEEGKEILHDSHGFHYNYMCPVGVNGDFFFFFLPISGILRWFFLRSMQFQRLHNQEYLRRVLGKLKGEADRTYQEASSPASSNSQLEEIQREILSCKSQLEDMENRLRIFEGDPLEITTLYEAEVREQILKETLRRVHMRKQVLEEKFSSSGAPPTSEVQTPSTLDWLAERDPQVQILNFLDSNGLLPLRGQPQHVVEILSPPPMLLQHGQNMNRDEQISPRSSGLVDNNNDNVHRPDFGQVIDVNLSSWTEIYPTGT